MHDVAVYITCTNFSHDIDNNCLGRYTCRSESTTIRS